MAFSAVFPADGVALVPELNQADGLHPNRAGVAVIVRRLRPYVVSLLEPFRASGAPDTHRAAAP